MSKTIRRSRKNGHQRQPSEVSRFFQSLFQPEEPKKRQTPHLATHAEQYQPFHYFAHKTNFLNLHPLFRLDAEALTEEERISRELHVPKTQSNSAACAKIFDHFLVIGSSGHTSNKPDILYQYPTEE